MLETFQKVKKILVFTDDDIWKSCFYAFDSSRYSVLVLENSSAALTDVLLFHPDVICLSSSFFIKTGLSFFNELIRLVKGIPVLILAREDDLTVSEWVIEQGGFFIAVEAKPSFVIRKIEECERKVPVKGEHRYEIPDLKGFEDFIGATEKMRSLKLQAARFAKSNLPILILGETGTGKTYLAHAIHDVSPRASRQFRDSSMANIQDTLAESTLFGTVKHAFTDAADTPGLFLEADGGTLFLDEIGEASLSLQSKLLHVLGQKRIQKVGSAREIPVDVRLITATNRNLVIDVEEGYFRQDLYYRIAPLTLEIPSLRQRIEDIPLLVSYFMRNDGRQLSRGAMEKLLSHTWPGNVRELASCISGTLDMCSSSIITESDIVFPPPAVRRIRHSRQTAE